MILMATTRFALRSKHSTTLPNVPSPSRRNILSGGGCHRNNASEVQYRYTVRTLPLWAPVAAVQLPGTRSVLTWMM